MRKILALLILLAIPAVAQFGGPMGGMRPGSMQGGGLLPGRGGDPLWVAAGPTKPKLDFDFAKRKDLTDAVSGKTSLVTFSRSAAQSPGTYVGADGLIHDAAVNLALYSEQFDNAAWSKEAGVTVTANQAIAPDGKQTADKVSSTTERGLWQTKVFGAGTYTFSVYLKATASTTGLIGRIYPGDMQSIDITTEWQRFHFTFTLSGSTTIYPQIRQSSDFGVVDVFIWGAQLEETDASTMAPTAYIHTTSQALAAPRFDHTPTTGNLTTNLLTYSEMFDQWTPAALQPIVVNDATSPDGTLTADKIIPSTASGAHDIHTFTGVISGEQYTLTAYAKPAGYDYVSLFNQHSGTGFGTIVFDVQGGSVVAAANGASVGQGSISSVGNGWFRAVYTFTATATSSSSYTGVNARPNGGTGVFAGNGTDGAHFWGAQLEAASSAGTYVRTLGETRSISDAVAPSLGLLVEEQRANLLVRSQEFDVGWATTSPASILANAIVAPDGTLSADKLQEATVSTNGKQLSQNLTPPSSATFSVYAKAGERNWIALLFGGTADSAFFDIQNGTVGTVSGAGTASIQDVGNGWYRCIYHDPNTSGTVNASIFLSSANGVLNYAGEIGKGAYLWGAQVEAGTFPTSYIPTTGSAQTRYADVATIEGTDFSSFYNATEGTLYAKFRSPTEATRGIASLDDGTANEAMALQSFYSTGAQFVVTDGGTQQVNTASSIITDDAAYVGVAGYKLNDFAVATAGDVAIDVAGTIPTVDRLRIGANQGGDYFNGHIARLAYWPVRQTNSTLDVISEPVQNDSYQILVKTDNTGLSNNDQFIIPAVAGTYDVDWGDGTTSTGVSGVQTHTYPAAGQYVIRMDGIEHYQTDNGYDKLKLLDIQNWGDEAWTSMGRAYYGSSNMIMSATDAPDLSGVTDMQIMFYGATAFNQPIGNWDVSSVTNIAQMLQNATSFNQPIGDWNVGSVTVYTNFMAGKTNLNYDAANLDAIYNGWIANELSPSEIISFGTIKYTAAGAEGRALLTRSSATVAVSNAVDNGSGLVRLTTAAHGLTTGNKVYIKGVVGTTEANGLHTVTVVDATTIDLQGTTFTNAYTSGGTVRTGYGWTITDGGI